MLSYHHKLQALHENLHEESVRWRADIEWAHPAPHALAEQARAGCERINETHRLQQGAALGAGGIGARLLDRRETHAPGACEKTPKPR